MKKFLTQQINFAYAVIVTLALTLGVAGASAAIQSDGYGKPGEVPIPILHQGGGEQAIQSLRLGECPEGAPSNAPCNPIGALDTRGPTTVGPVTLFESALSNPTFAVLDDMVVLGRLYVAENTAQFISDLVTGNNPNSIVPSQQKVNVEGDVLITSLTHGNLQENVCISDDGVLILCPDLELGSCGPAAGHSYSSPPTNGLCSAGTASSVTTNSTTYDWTCTGTGGAVNCQANRVIPVNGDCGPAAGHTYSSPPTNGLCTAGNAGPVTTTPTNYNWTCYGTGGGTNDSCQANRTIAVNGQCENFPGVYSTQPANSSNGCIAGVYNDLSEGVGSPPPWRWECLGTGGGSDDTPCLADAAPVGNPACRPYTGAYATQPATNNSTGCDVGTYADTTDTASLWRWTCTDNGVTNTCSANKEVYNGYYFVCGTDPDGTYGPGQSAPNESRWAQWTRGSGYSPDNSGDTIPFNMGAYDCTNPITLNPTDPWVLPSGLNPSSPANDGYDGTMTNPTGTDKLYWKFFCLDAAPSDCLCHTANANQQMC